MGFGFGLGFGLEFGFGLGLGLGLGFGFGPGSVQPRPLCCSRRTLLPPLCRWTRARSRIGASRTGEGG